MLESYQCRSREDYKNALKEIMQDLALLGLWRAKFFEHASFYGGTALRIFYKHKRFSEDLDFSLLAPKKNFELRPYLRAVEDELNSFGFEVEVSPKIKKSESQIDSAFIKASTHIQFLKVKAPTAIQAHIQSNELIKIKIEVDTNPPCLFDTEMKTLLQPIPFQVKIMALEDLFAGKLHAVLARQWKNRVKGRDYYDLIWYVARKTPYRINHLEARLKQSGLWPKDQRLTHPEVRQMLKSQARKIDFGKASNDVKPFIETRERESLQLWNSDFFDSIIDQTIPLD